MAKAMDDAMLALFQNGERLRPENGYPLRLFLPGWEGNMSVKWLRRLKVVPAPIMTKDETSKYSDLQADGRSLMFTFPMNVKSVITRPSHGMTLSAPGLYQISGLAWSGNGTITKVDVSTDGGRTWTGAPLGAPVLPRALTRFRLPWRWDGGAAVLKSRAADDAGATQPERDTFIAEHGGNVIYHYHAIQAWSVAPSGEVKHVYA
jgi:sulfane dehydrogenase subunit SoxC